MFLNEKPWHRARLLLPLLSHGQGRFLIWNNTAHTLLGTTNGPEAGLGFWGQMLVGLTPDSLTPVGTPLEHRVNGTILGGVIEVPGIDGGTFAFVQMWAWDAARWGTSLEAVPQDQFGRTDIVPHLLAFSFDPAFAPQFTQPAIVPIPEPSTVALAALGAGALWFATRGRRRKSFSLDEAKT